VYYGEIPEETLADVMWEIAEERERPRESVDAQALRERIEAEIKSAQYGHLSISIGSQGVATQQAYRRVLGIIDELQES
jgi:hypothetical protein